MNITRGRIGILNNIPAKILCLKVRPIKKLKTKHRKNYMELRSNIQSVLTRLHVYNKPATSWDVWHSRNIRKEFRLHKRNGNIEGMRRCNAIRMARLENKFNNLQPALS